MAGESNGNKRDRLDRIEEALEACTNEHAQFREEHRQLLKAQVLLYDSVQKLTQSQAKSKDPHQELAERRGEREHKPAKPAESFSRLDRKLAKMAQARKNADERMAALLALVDETIRRPPTAT